jgi:hypothetical protein
MPETAPKLLLQQGDLHLEVQDEDWVAIRGTKADLERLGEWLIEFARAEGTDCAILDSPGLPFRSGSLGIYLYRAT